MRWKSSTDYIICTNNANMSMSRVHFIQKKDEKNISTTFSVVLYFVSFCYLWEPFGKFDKFQKCVFVWVYTQLPKMRKKIQFQIRVWMVARLPQRLKSTFFEKKFFTPGLLRGSSKKCQKTLILAFEANSALSWQNGIFPSFSSLCTSLYSTLMNVKM